MTDELTRIRQILNEKVAEDLVKEKAFDSLYSELKQYKDDFIYQVEKGVLLDLLLFYDSLQWFQESLITQEMSPDVIADSFQYLIDEFIEVLYRRDVAPMDAAETFDRKRHKAVKVETTEDPESDYKIAQILKRGFVRGERILRAEEVVINRVRGGRKS